MPFRSEGTFSDKAEFITAAYDVKSALESLSDQAVGTFAAMAVLIYDQLHIIKRIHNTLALYQNYFQPSQKFISKTRIGAKVTKKYDAAHTACQRLLPRPDTREQTKRLLCETFRDPNPFELPRAIQDLISQVYPR